MLPLGPPEHSAPVSSRPSALNRFTRGRKGRVCIFPSFSILCLPFGLSRVALRPPCPLLVLSVHLFVCPVFSLAPIDPSSPSAFLLVLFQSYPLGLVSLISGPRISAQLQALLAKHIFQPVPRPARAKWLNLQRLVFILLNRCCPSAWVEGSQGRPPPVGPTVGQGAGGEGLFAVDTPDPWKELKQLFSTSEK